MLRFRQVTLNHLLGGSQLFASVDHYDTCRACFRSGENRVLDSTGAVERIIPFNETDNIVSRWQQCLHRTIIDIVLVKFVAREFHAFAISLRVFRRSFSFPDASNQIATGDGSDHFWRGRTTSPRQRRAPQRHGHAVPFVMLRC
jgi:hypothetical protein